MTIAQFQKTILSWHKKNRRNMPWRKTKDPYKILVSEVMLQQTQVARVVPKYQEFLCAFPTLRALGEASDNRVLSVWRGLGYWKRALALKKAAQEITRKHKERFPNAPEELERLPGIGPYTARAVACFAFQCQEPFLDTNIRRVYLHFFFPEKENVTDKEILKIARKGLYQRNPREWHYALFDYGAIVLKNKKINKQSKHYAKQSRFEGSFRSFRTKVMRFLLDQYRQTAPKSRLEKLLKEANTPYSPMKILSSLEKDGLVKRQRNSYSL